MSYCCIIAAFYHVFISSQLAEVTADLSEEHTTSTHATEMLESETAERLRLEKELKELQVRCRDP